jgi:predicted small secreted protein
MKKLAILVLLAALLGGCETVKGVGRDIENAGEAIDDALD